MWPDNLTCAAEVHDLLRKPQGGVHCKEKIEYNCTDGSHDALL